MCCGNKIGFWLWISLLKTQAAAMEKIAVMLSDTERPRVTRFMRAAVHAPNPKIQRIANEYLSISSVLRQNPSRRDPERAV
jgi:hypothetical protein